jgi:putative tryptophan/tyrosine transport system substrate-binding protein
MLQFSPKGRNTMRRREFIAVLTFAAAMGRAQAQQTGKVYRIAFGHPTVPVADQNQASKGSFAVPAFFEELTRLGYVEGRNLLIERYSGEGRAAHYPDLARQIVSRKPDLIIAFSGRFVLDVKAATSTIPIVGMFADPIALGIVPSLARPGGNITGISVDVGMDQWLKRVQLLKEAVPQITRLGILDTRDVRESDIGKKVHSAIERENALKNSFSIVGPPLEHPTDEHDYQRVFAALAQDGAEGLLVYDQPENLTYRTLIVELAAKGRLPTIYPYRQFVEAGGLMSYGIDVSDLGHRVADLADKILKGAKPGDIPIFQPTHFELSINLKTAKTLGIELPPLLVVRADNVIE